MFESYGMDKSSRYDCIANSRANQLIDKELRKYFRPGMYDMISPGDKDAYNERFPEYDNVSDYVNLEQGSRFYELVHWFYGIYSDGYDLRDNDFIGRKLIQLAMILKSEEYYLLDIFLEAIVIQMGLISPVSVKVPFADKDEFLVLLGERARDYSGLPEDSPLDSEARKFFSERRKAMQNLYTLVYNDLDLELDIVVSDYPSYELIDEGFIYTLKQQVAINMYYPESHWRDAFTSVGSGFPLRADEVIRDLRDSGYIEGEPGSPLGNFSFSLVDCFMNDDIVINGEHYGRMEFDRLSSDFDLRMLPHPVEPAMSVAEYSKGANVMGVDSVGFGITTRDGIICDIMLRPTNMIQYIALVSSLDYETVNTPFGEYRSFRISDDRSIIYMPGQGTLALIWG